jgi:hypothetical protein
VDLPGSYSARDVASFAQAHQLPIRAMSELQQMNDQSSTTLGPDVHTRQQQQPV